MNFIRKSFETLSPQRFFLIVASFFGSLFLFLTPPFQVPDEPNHFYRAWQISEGGFISVKQDQRVGGYLPSNLQQIVIPFQRIMWNKENKFSAAQPEEVFKISTKGPYQFYDFNNTALYSPVCYAPQAFAIFIFRNVLTSPLSVFYGARVITFLSWLLIVFLAIKIIPTYKWLYSLMALLPMSLFINMSLSADVMTNALCFLFIAFVFRLRFQNDLMNKKQFLFLLLLVALLASVKIVYSPLLLLLFIIPRSKFLNTKTYCINLGGVFLLALICILIWSHFISSLYIPYDQYNPEFRDTAALARMANMYVQLAYLKGSFSNACLIISESMRECSLSHVEGYIGLFGWLDTKLPNWMLICIYSVLLIVAASDSNPLLRFTFWQKLFFVFIFFIILIMLFLSQYLSWAIVGVPSVTYIQGRYLIPFYSLFFIFFQGFIPRNRLAKPLVIITTLLSLSFTLLLLYSRYISEVI